MRAALLLFLLLASCTPRFLAGAAATDLTPPMKVPLAGYGNRAGKKMTGVHDAVMAKALWIETPSQRICLVTTDLIGSLDGVRREVLEKVADLKLDALIIAASHNHSGPGAVLDAKNIIIQMTVGAYNPKMRSFLVDKLADVVRAAAENRESAELAVGLGQESGLSRNRRSEHYEGDGPIDPEVFVLEIRAGGKPKALLTNFTAHGTVLGGGNMQMSGGWAGSFQREMESRLPGTVALFTNGAEGDIAPRAPAGKDDFERCERMGKALADRVMDIRKGIAKPTNRVTIRYRERGVDLPKPKYGFAPRASVVGVLEVNDSVFLCVPGEMCVEIGLDLKKEFRRRFGYRTATILGLANDHLYYILTRAQYGKGGYERSMSFYGPDLETIIKERLIETGTELRREN